MALERRMIIDTIDTLRRSSVLDVSPCMVTTRWNCDVEETAYVTYDEQAVLMDDAFRGPGWFASHLWQTTQDSSFCRHRHQIRADCLESLKFFVVGERVPCLRQVDQTLSDPKNDEPNTR